MLAEEGPLQEPSQASGQKHSPVPCPVVHLQTNQSAIESALANPMSSLQCLGPRPRQDLGGLAERRIDVNDFCRSAALRAMASGQAWRRATLGARIGCDLRGLNGYSYIFVRLMYVNITFMNT